MPYVASEASGFRPSVSKSSNKMSDSCPIPRGDLASMEGFRNPWPAIVFLSDWPDWLISFATIVATVRAGYLNRVPLLAFDSMRSLPLRQIHRCSGYRDVSSAEIRHDSLHSRFDLTINAMSLRSHLLDWALVALADPWPSNGCPFLTLS